ncbi:MAG TPA: hotdog fold thioesterase [Gemmatimonadales bacterium]|nr:hotdog fold thioesterase [Gemmatimonadales bacterium]
MPRLHAGGWQASSAPSAGSRATRHCTEACGGAPRARTRQGKARGPIRDIIDEPPRGSIGDLRPFQHSGLERLRLYIRGEFPGPPISRLLGLKPTEAGLGKATFTLPVTRWLEEGFGLYWGGVYALLADAPLALAIWTTLPPGKTVTTSELSLSFVRPMSRKTTNIVGRAETVHAGKQVGLSMIQITDQEGRMLAFGSTRCLIADVPIDLGKTYPAPDLGPSDPPDPYLLPAPEDGYFNLDEVMNGVPIELQRQTVTGEKVFPIWRLTGYRPTEVQDGLVRARLPTSAWFSGGGASLYGGLLAWAADFTMGASVYSTLGAGDVFATLDMHIRFTRPALVNSGDLTLTATVRHRGRLLRVASCDIDNAEGKRVAMATASALVVEDGVRKLRKGMLPDEILASGEEGEDRSH